MEQGITNPSPRRPFSEERFLSVMEVAQMLGYRDDEAVRLAIRQGRLRAVQPSPRRVLVTESDVGDWLEASRVEAEMPAGTSRKQTAPRVTQTRIVRRRELPILGGVAVRP